jgi:hypothetical protein
MKLLQLIENEVTFGAPTHTNMLLDLTLKEVVDAGGVTNNYQILAIARVAGFFKNGLKSADLNLNGPVTYGDESTTEASRAAIEALSGPEQARLAQYLLDCIAAGESMLHHSCNNTAEWIRFVLQKQD